MSDSPTLHALIDFADPAVQLGFGAPLRVHATHTVGGVRGVLDAVADEAAQGRWCVGYLRYEAAPAFDAALVTHPHDSNAGPLAWFGVHEEALPLPAPVRDGARVDWQDLPPRSRFDADISHILAAIAAGELYQVNHTATLQGRLCAGDPRALFDALRRAQPRAYAAFIDAGHEQILSASPELFFHWDDGRIESRPMKGTAARGNTPDEDAALAAALRASDKERAENLMIVDLIRNDLSRFAEPFSVHVPRLFALQAWPTVWQMSSVVEARTRPGTTLTDVFAALFPCGSVTGAPKVQAMRMIRRLEPAPRGVYCGAVGIVQPGGAATFNVPIRTLRLAGDRATCGIGSGITADARADGEWQEWRTKRGFVERASAPFALLETMRLDGGVFRERDAHLARLARAAAHFGFACDPGVIGAALDALAAERPQGCWRVRLLVDVAGQPALEVHAHEDWPGPRRVQLAASALAEAGGEFVRFKTTRRAHYDALAPRDPGAFDTLLWNAAGELTEFTRGNACFELADGRWVTPPLHCGLLDGIGRAAALREGRVSEAVVRVDELPQVRRIAFFNSLRGWIDVTLV
ncbi:aminodeoxychorismate synthase component I [Aquincola sp. S2]|uniref:Aminodeoxychorismate synthase component I n=1 Tax=Pseudaquabacterium terrae TaxID=2732868 RepID=A0ABX2ECD0_9BURK|nr:aminodeoxychorismate synthase component I [Aquabacterium terrae]NRF66042.1 aminodeoxychorismate synthase component I [Aquabacterium terrae]